MKQTPADKAPSKTHGEVIEFLKMARLGAMVVSRYFAPYASYRRATLVGIFDLLWIEPIADLDSHHFLFPSILQDSRDIPADDSDSDGIPSDDD